jgi:fucose permease
MTNKFRKTLLVSTAYLTIATLGIYVTIYQYTILTISQFYELNASAMGFLIAMQQLGVAIPPLFVGAAAGRLGKKKIVQASFGLLVLGTFLIGITNSFAAFIASIVVIGAGFAVTEGTISAILSDEFPEESRRHLNFSQVFFSIGALTGPLIAEALIGAGIYFKNLYLYISALFALLSVSFFFTKQKNDRPAAAESPAFSLTGFFKNKVLLLFAAGMFLYVGAETTVANFADSYFELSLKMPELSATALALFWGAMIPSRFLAGVLKIDVRKLFTVLSVMMLVTAVSAMLVPDITVKIILFALCGFFCGPMWPLIMDETAKRNRGASGGSMNIMMACCGFGGAVLPLIAGFGVSLGGESIAYYISGAASVLMLLALISAQKAPNRDLKA